MITRLQISAQQSDKGTGRPAFRIPGLRFPGGAPVLALAAILMAAGCATTPPNAGMIVWEAGPEFVRLDTDPSGTRYSHPVHLTAAEVATLLRGVRSGEHRNVIHRLFTGEAKKYRTFQDDDIAHLAEPLAMALAKAAPTERVYFHLSEPNPQGGEISTAGWIAVREPVLILQLSEARDLHAPGSDISKYVRSLPDIPIPPTPFEATFEPEEFLLRQDSLGSWFAPDQLEELRILYRRVLTDVPQYRLPGQNESHSGR